MRAPRITPALFVVALLAAAAVYAVPRAIEAVASLDDPASIAGWALDGKFDAAVAQREIEAALASRDAELAQSFVDLAADRRVSVDPMLIEKVKAVSAEAATMRHKAESFVRGLITGESDDMAALAGTTLGDLFVFGDIRDAVREGMRLATGAKADELVLGFAGVGVAITAGTYVTLGAVAPARVGLTLAKAARKTGSLGVELARNLDRMFRQAGPGRAGGGGARAARGAAKAERAGGLLHFVRDVGRIENAAGGRAALDGLKIAEQPRDMARIARLAEKEGSRTRAILKVAGRGAITLGALAFDVSAWILGALFALFGFVSALKTATERATLRILHRRKERRRRKEMQPIAAALARS